MDTKNGWKNSGGTTFTFDTLDELIQAFEDGKISVEEYTDKYNEIQKKESLKWMALEPPEQRESG